jgi:D-glycero-D-manno-heptose 1,7-bisphosphate phosphatase
LQAVVLAGGRGERLRPLTDQVPKPMVDVGGKPFIHQLLLQLEAFGISDVLILAGYKSEVIEDYFSLVNVNNLRIRIVKSDESLSKSERIMHAKNLIQPSFMLLYSDNYAQFEVWKIVNHPGKNVITISKKNPGNILIDRESMLVKRFFHGQRVTDATHVEIGYSKFDKKSLIKEIEKTHDLDAAISNLTLADNLYAVELPHGYLSISDPVRLEHTRSVFSSNEIVLIDRDGIINQKPAKANYLVNENDIKYISETLEFMSRVSKRYSKKFIVISNQAGIARGIMTGEQVDRINLKIQDDLRKYGIQVIEFLYCPHGWDDGCDCRKPNPGLLFKASEKYGFVLRNTFFIGDDIRDSEAAIRSGAKAVLVNKESTHLAVPNVISVSHLNAEIVKIVGESEL